MLIGGTPMADILIWIFILTSRLMFLTFEVIILIIASLCSAPRD